MEIKGESMTKKTIVLPIKCNTLKTVFNYLTAIISIELFVLTCQVLLHVFGCKFVNLYSAQAIIVYQNLLIMAILMGAYLAVIWLIVFVGAWIFDHFPILECIKEEPE